MGVLSIFDKQKLNEAEQGLKKVAKAAKETKEEFKDAPENINKTGKALGYLGQQGEEAGDQLSKGLQKGTGFLKEIQDVLKNSEIFAFVGGIKNIAQTFEKAATKQAEYIENLNFLDQAYNNSAESGLRLLDTLEKTVGYDPAGLTRQLAIFRQFGNALNMDDKIANRLAENLLKLSIDTKSITGDSLDKVMNRYSSALAGSTRAVRAYGIDITVAGLQQQALALGIEKSVTDMNRAEKTILTYITMARQMSSANGDMAKTVNSVANQYEIFKSQIGETVRLLGGFLIPILKAVLPLINGVMMAINILLSSLLSLFGIDAGSLSEEFGTVAVDLDDISDGFDDIGTSATKAGKAAKEAQKSLRGFDKLNVITTPTSTSAGGTGGKTGGGGGVSGLGGIDSSLLDKLGEYDLHLDSISNKAADIRDSIMDWLGFTKYIDPITGDISWEYEGIGKTLSNIWKTLGDLIGGVLRFDPIAIAAVLAIGKGLLTIWNLGKKIVSIIGGSKIFTFFKNLPPLLQLGAAAAIGFKLSFDAIHNGMQSIIEDGANFGNVMQTTAGALGNVATGALIGSAVFPGLGTAVGAAVGAFISLYEILTSFEERDVLGEMLESAGSKLDKFTQSLQNEYDQVEKNANQDMSKIIASEKLIAELDKITDANGRVKKGYEDQAAFIINQLNTAYGTEIKMVDGVIQEYDKQIKTIKKQMEIQKAKIYQQYAEEKYAIAIKKQAEAENLLNEALSREKTIREDPTLDEDARAQKLAEVSRQIDRARNNIKQNQKAVLEYEGISKAVLTGNEKDIKHWEKEISKSMGNAETSVWDYYGSAARASAEYYKTNLELTGKSYDQLNKQQKQAVTKQLDDFIDMFEKGVKEVGEITPEMVVAWREMANNSEEAFMVALGKLPKDMRQQVVDKMYPQGQGMSKELQKGINSKFPEIKITPQLKQPTQSTINSFLNTLKSKLESNISVSLTGIGTSLTTKADGGLYSNGTWKPMKTYAGGGFPSHGEIFLAREARGPELVGKIGNSTAVMNNDQILDQMTIAVARGMSAVEQKDTNVNIIAQGDAEGMLNFIKFKQISKNRQYGL